MFTFHCSDCRRLVSHASANVEYPFGEILKRFASTREVFLMFFFSCLFLFSRKRNDVFHCLNHDWLKVRNLLRPKRQRSEFFCSLPVCTRSLFFALRFSLWGRKSDD